MKRYEVSLFDGEGNFWEQTLHVNGPIEVARIVAAQKAAKYGWSVSGVREQLNVLSRLEVLR